MESHIITYITTLPGLLAVAITGMLMHFFKQKIKGESITEIKAFFSDNFKSTIIAVVGTLVTSVATYMALATGQPIDILTFFGIGYMCDSAFNRWEKTPS